MEDRLRISAAKCIGLLVCWWVLGFVLCAAILSLVPQTGSVGVLRFDTVLQDVVVFILPVIATALIAAVKPWRYLRIDCRPNAVSLLLSIGIVLLSVPAMNAIVEWNSSMKLPESMVWLENALRASEDAAAGMVDSMIGGKSVADLIVSVLIVGVLTGVAEELFFRGMLQRVLADRFGNRHAAIWAAAVIFSAVHLQFFGFVPRVLMGAFFGYLLSWTGSLWVPVTAHAFNNSMVVLTTWLAGNNYLTGDINAAGTSGSLKDVVLVLCSIGSVIGMLVLLQKSQRQRRRNACDL